MCVCVCVCVCVRVCVRTYMCVVYVCMYAGVGVGVPLFNVVYTNHYGPLATIITTDYVVKH